MRCLATSWLGPRMLGQGSVLAKADGTGTSALAEWRRLGQLLDRRGHVGALALEEVVDRATQLGIVDVMRRVGRDWHITACDLVLALGAGFDPSELVLDRVLDRLVVAELEMQERMVLDAAPVATEQGLGADEVDGAGDPAPAALGHHQKNAVAHLLADERIERAGEVRTPPLARAGLHVEVEKVVPHAFGEIGAGQPMHADAVGERILALAPDGLALAGGERGEEVVEGRVAGVLPMKLLVRALEVAALAEQLPFRLGREGDVHR